MKKQLAAAALILSAACASTDGGDDMPAAVAVPQQAAPDPRIGELQTQLTELLERLDVLNSRLARVEEGGGEAAATPAAEVRVTRPVITEVPQTSPAQRTTPGRVAGAAPQPAQPQQPQRALVGAALAEEYRQAIILFGRGRHADARRAFEAVFETDSAGDLADNALFWIGETWFAAGNYTNAMRYYNRVVNEFSDQNKAPDALFKIALTHERTGDLALARRTFQQVIDRYPYSSTASSAKAELQRIRY
jgi:tol-pal system protein YbgF